MFKKVLFIIGFLTAFSGLAQSVPDTSKCFEIEIKDSDITIDTRFKRDDNNPDLYKVCRNKRITVSASVNAPIRRTDRYEVNEIPYEPYPVTGTDIPFPVVDNRAAVDIELPFTFCFYDLPWDRISVHSNGYISFTDGVQFKAQPGAHDPHSAIPTTNPGLLNTVFMQRHYHWRTGDTGAIRFAVYGEAPCRVAVVTWNNILAYQLQPQHCQFLLPQTFQIAFHETTNFIDLIAIRKELCPPFATQGNATWGINNTTGTQGLTPPGKNLGLIPDAIQESWRFAPNGDLLYRMEWEVDGEVVAGDVEEIDVIIDKTKEITAKVIADGNCDDRENTGERRHTITVRPAIEVDQVDLEPIVCDKDIDTFDLGLITQLIKEAQTIDEEFQDELEKLRFEYYYTENDATDKTNIIQDLTNSINDGSNELFVRVEDADLDECFEILPLNIIKAPVELAPKEPVFICEEYILPTLTNGDFYYKLEKLDENAEYTVRTISDVYENMAINEYGYYNVYFKNVNQYGCEDVKYFPLLVESCSYPKGISPNNDGENDYLDLTYNNVHELKIYNRHGKLVYEHGKGYKREWAGQDSNGKLLPAGTYFMYVKTENYEHQDWIQLTYETK